MELHIIVYSVIRFSYLMELMNEDEASAISKRKKKEYVGHSEVECLVYCRSRSLGCLALLRIPLAILIFNF